jgi:signal transduction histidine kinase
VSVGLREARALIAAAIDVEHFDARPVSRQVLDEICEAATGAVRAGASPCRVLVVVGDERERLIAGLSSALARHWGADALAPTGLASEAVLSAPAFVLVFASATGDTGFDLGAVSAAAAQNIALLCRAAGLGTHRILAARVVPEAVLDYAAGYFDAEIRKGDLIAMFAVGYADVAGAATPGTKPAWADEPPHGGESAIDAQPPPTLALRAQAAERVLLVDLYPYNRAFLDRHLEAAGYRVEVCKDGHSLEEAIGRGGDPELLLLSDILPDTTGFHLVRHLRARYGSRAPVIVTTSRRDTAFRIAGLAVGVDYYLRKPLNVVELLSAARLLLDRRRAHDELERTLRELRTAQARLVQQGKMAALGQLVAGVAHEINTPLAAIVSNNDLFDRAFGRMRSTIEGARVEGLGQQLAAIEELTRVSRDAGARITGIVRTLRTFARLDESELKTVDLREGIESTLVLIAHQLKTGIGVVRDYAELPLCECHPNQINQVFMNLIVNACQAMGESGTLTLRTRAEKASVLVQVADTGCGIPADRISRIFDPGYTTKGAALGTGLGLAIVYQIVEAHGGEISVESSASGPHRGTTFSLRLPVSGKR